MEIEAQTNHGVFYPINENHIYDMKYNNVLCQIEVSLHQFQAHTHKLFLTRNFIFLAEISQYGNKNQQNQQIYATKIDFELKFQVEFAQEDKPQSQKIGLSLFRSQQRSNMFYSSNESSLQMMRNHLGRFINQKGFHCQFKPVKKLGKGNFASVYQVIRVEDGSKFAVKAFSKANTYNTQNGKESLINQLSVMRQLSHQSKNLLCLEAVYESDNSIYIVLQLLEGKNLYEVIKQKNGNFTISEVRVIMQGLLRGLKCMAEKKIMHRDLKPENIMFRAPQFTTSNTYEPVIVDFGLAARSDIVPYLFFRCGTPGFVAPQIIKIQQNQAYSPACDMFSVGCIFHLLMTNCPIFPGTKYEEVYKKNKSLQFTIKQQQINKLNPFGLDLLERMLDSSPAQRLSPTEALNNCFFVDMKSPLNENIKIDQDQISTEYPISPTHCLNRGISINI